MSVGTITGFGSVIVNGVRFDDRTAEVTINDRVATASQLRVGMVVAVEGSIGACPNTDDALCDGVAARIRFRNNLDGPITAINRLSNTLQVMGRDVIVDDSTAFDGTSVSDLSALAVGDMVAVSGLAEQQRLRAQLVQRTGVFAAGTTPITVYGPVANINASAGTCTVDGVPVRFRNLSAGELPVGGLADGQYVAAQGRNFGSGLMTADRIQLRDRISLPDASSVELEGYVAAYLSIADFTVDGRHVDASAALFRNGTAADLKNGAKVEVEGTMSGAVLLASKLIFRAEASAQIAAPIQSKNAGAASLVVLGQSVKTTPLTQFVEHAAAGGSMGGPPSRIGYADLQVNDRVDVRVYKDGSGLLVATRVERTDPSELLVARGAVDAKAPVRQLTLLGIDVGTGAATRYRDVSGNLITDITFYGLVQVPPAVPTIVRAQGVANAASGHAIDATRITNSRGEVEIAR